MSVDQMRLVAPAPTAVAAPSLGPPAAAAGPSRRGDDETSASRSAAQTFFADGLHSIFSFLTLRELAVASRCCRGWRAAASTQPSLRLFRAAAPTTLQTIANSRIARHIGELVITGCTPRGVSSVVSLACRLPCLTRLSLSVGNDPARPSGGDSPGADWWGTDEEHTTMQMPSTLRELDVHLSPEHFRVMDWSVIDTLLARVCHAGTPPLTALRIRCGGIYRWSIQFDTQIPVETLRRLLVLKDSLTDLSLEYYNPHFADEAADGNQNFRPARWTQQHIDVFRQLTRIEKLYPFRGRWSDEELIMLCAEPAPAHLHSLRLNAPPTTDAGREALARLPHDCRYSGGQK